MVLDFSGSRWNEKKDPKVLISITYRIAVELCSAIFGAGNDTRTRDPDLGKVVLYQLSYSRILVKAAIL